MNVVQFAVRADSQARGNRNNAFIPERIEKFGVCSCEIADVSETAGFVVVHQWFGAEALRIGRRNSYRRLTGCGDSRGELFIKQAGKYHDGDIAGFAVRD